MKEKRVRPVKVDGMNEQEWANLLEPFPVSHYPRCNALCRGDSHYMDNTGEMPPPYVTTAKDVHAVIRELTGWKHGHYADWETLSGIQKAWWETSLREVRAKREADELYREEIHPMAEWNAAGSDND